MLRYKSILEIIKRYLSIFKKKDDDIEGLLIDLLMDFNLSHSFEILFKASESLSKIQQDNYVKSINPLLKIEEVIEEELTGIDKCFDSFYLFFNKIKTDIKSFLERLDEIDPLTQILFENTVHNLAVYRYLILDAYHLNNNQTKGTKSVLNRIKSYAEYKKSYANKIKTIMEVYNDFVDSVKFIKKELNINVKLEKINISSPAKPRFPKINIILEKIDIDNPPPCKYQTVLKLKPKKK